jgi:hypothetical protein
MSVAVVGRPKAYRDGDHRTDDSGPINHGCPAARLQKTQLFLRISTTLAKTPKEKRSYR